MRVLPAEHFTHDDFGIITDYRWAKGPLLETDRPYRLSGARLMRVLEGSIRYRINLLEYEVAQGQVIWIPDSALVEFLSASEDYRLQAIGKGRMTRILLSDAKYLIY